MRRFSLTPVLACILLLAACGGRGSTSSPNRSYLPAQPTPQLMQLAPPLPSAEPFIAQRMAATAQAELKGSQAFQTSASHAVTLGARLQLISTAGASADAAAWGMYRFNGAPGEKLEAAGFSAILRAHPSGQRIWLAVSNYAQQRWEWLDGGDAPTGEVALSGAAGAYSGSGGQTYVLLLAHGGMEFDVDTLYLRYSARQYVSGTVQENDGTPIPGALVASPAGQQSVLTGSDGTFQFTLPAGDWPLVTTKDGYTFYSNPAVINVTNTAVSGVVLTGRRNGSHFLPGDPGSYNNTILTATAADLQQGPASETLSALDDPADCFSFSVDQPGQYFLEYTNSALDVYFPLLTLYSASGRALSSAPSPVAGTLRLPLLVGEAGQSYRVEVGCSGGGGSYSLSLGSGPCEHLHGTLLTAGSQPLDGCLVSASNTLQGDVTQYLTAIDGTYDDLNRAPVPTQVTPGAAYLSFAPAGQSVDLGAGPQLACDFTGTGDTLADTHEPNNTPGDAAVFSALTLPYDSDAASEELSATSGFDSIDFYKVTPPAGSGLKVTLATDGDHPVESALSISLMQSDGFITLSTGYVTPEGLEVRLPTLANGNPLLIRVAYQALSIRSRAYHLKAETFVPHILKFQVNYGSGVGVPNAVVELRRPSDPAGQQAYFVRRLTTNASGATETQYIAAGEVFQAELLRYGFSNHRNTQQITMPDTALTVPFTADPAQSSDHFEPNDSSTTGASLLLPASIDATFDPLTDPKDYYFVSIDDANPLKVELTEPVALAGNVRVTLESTNGAVASMVELNASHGSGLLTAPNPGGWVLEVDDPGMAGAYHLAVSSTPAFHLRGNTAGPGQSDFVHVYSPELGRSADYDPVNHVYDFGLVPPGTYTVQVYCRGFVPTPPEDTATVVDTDSGVDFNFAAQNVDGLEPNNTSGTAAALTTDGTPTMLVSIGSGSGMSQDSNDWYKFDATAGQLCQVRVRRGGAWWPPVSCKVFAPGNSLLGAAVEDGADQLFTFLAPADGTYTVQVQDGPVEYTLDVLASN